MSQSSAIHFDQVTKSYTLPDGSALKLYNDLSFEIPTGTFASLMGASGSGKSTLLNLIAGLVLPDAGTITVLDNELDKLTDTQRTLLRGQQIGFVFQSFDLLPYLTVKQNIEVVLDLNRIERRRTTDEMCALVGLSEKKDYYPGQLSGGEQQRVAIARALIGKTQLILADEPTGNLDQKTSAQIMDLLQDLHRHIGCTIVLITHDPQIASRTELHFTLEDGKIIEG